MSAHPCISASSSTRQVCCLLSASLVSSGSLDEPALCAALIGDKKSGAKETDTLLVNALTNYIFTRFMGCTGKPGVISSFRVGRYGTKGFCVYIRCATATKFYILALLHR